MIFRLASSSSGPCGVALGAALLSGACNMPNPAFGLDTETEGASGAGSDASGTGTGTGTGTSASGTGTSAGSASATSVGSTGGTTAGASSGATGPGTTGQGSAGTTGGLNICPMPSPEVLLVEHMQGAPTPTVVEECGSEVQIAGLLNSYNPGTGQWLLKTCANQQTDPCDLGCQSPELEGFKFSLPLPGLDPPATANGCFTATMVWNDDCSFAGGTIFGLENGGFMALEPAWAGRGAGPLAGVLADLTFKLDPSMVAPCDCEGQCCVQSPGEYKLKVSGITLNNTQFLYSGDTDTGTSDETDAGYSVGNLASHVGPACDGLEMFNWVVAVKP